MNEQEKRTLNEKLARWAGNFDFTPDGRYEAPNGDWNLDFTDSLDACFKWLVPKLYPYPENKIDIHFKRETSYPDHTEQIHCWFYLNGKLYKGWSLNLSATALCRAIEKRIDGCDVATEWTVRKTLKVFEGKISGENSPHD